ncbi:hypothetical protein [Actinoplanes subglobosus]|uniref:Uncharacterized protein n=1 Tax=Actinoplanes subglobosus TaxID=1547892 RepID=A0ABV8IR48_9ACTN
MARAYRARRRAERAKKIQAFVIRAYATPFVPDATAAALASAENVMAMMRCPVCGVVVWKRVHRRRNAVYCSNACRTRAWRERRTIAHGTDHDAEPSP